MRHLKQPYDAILNMPTYERRFYLITLKNEIDGINERTEQEMNKTNSTGRGTRSTTLSGTALKSKINDGEIPQ